MEKQNRHDYSEDFFNILQNFFLFHFEKVVHKLFYIMSH